MALLNKYIDIGIDYISNGFKARSDSTFTPGFRKSLTRMDLRIKHNMLWFNLTAIQHLDNFSPVARRTLNKKVGYRQVINKENILCLKLLHQKMHFSKDSVNALG